MLEDRKIKVDPETQLQMHIHEKGHRNWLIVTHGLGEYGLRHKHLVSSFSEKFNICFYDLRGHGNSDGEKAHAEDFSLFAQDLKSVINCLKENYLMTSYKLFGHSMGGLVVCDYIQNFSDESFYPTSIFLSSPAVSPTGALGVTLKKERLGLTKILSKLPYIKLAGLLDIKKLSHDLRVYNNYLEDPLTHTKLSTKLVFLIIERSKLVFSKKLEAKCPIYVVIGSEDFLVGVKPCTDYFRNVESSASLQVIEGGYHELHNEVQKYYNPYFEYLESSLLND